MTFVSSLHAETALELKSSYTFKYLLLDVYKIDLYLGQSNSTEQALDDIPKKLVFTYNRDIPAKLLVKKANESLADNPNFSFSKFQKDLDSLNKTYVDVKQGDVYIMQYTPSIGTELFLNSKKITTIPGYEFSKYYFGIWLSEYSFSKKLYKALVKP